MDTLSQLLRKVAITLCDGVGSPRALSVKLLIEHEEYVQLFSLKTEPHHYSDSESYFRDCQVTEFLRKLELDLPGLDLQGDAERLFLSCEAENTKTNARLKHFSDGFYETPGESRIEGILLRARRIVSGILRRIPDDLSGRFGPGATFEDLGKMVTIPDKMSSRPTVTSGAKCFETLWSRTAWCRSLYSQPSKSSPKIVRGNRFTTVPKDALKRRGICVEPSLNVYYQLAVGRHIRSKLQRAGLNLLEAQHVHRSVARAASSSGAFATIDLSNASDLVSYELVKLLVPRPWFELLDSLRSPFTRVNGRWYHLQKFSSMGNGYTFELETLLFLALAIACAQECNHEDSTLNRGVWVYGDDIIVPTDLAPVVVACLKWCGLKPNTTKTFLTGSFRESCGGDFFDGVAVRPHYQKEDPDEPQKRISMANGLRRSADRDFSRRSFLLRPWFETLDSLPTGIRKLRGPESFGDLVIHDDKRWCFREHRDGRGEILTYSPVTRLLGWEYWKPETVLASALYGLSSDGVPFRGNVTGYRARWTACLERAADYQRVSL